MKSALLILTLGSVSALGQQSTVIGSIERITGSEITVKSLQGSFAIHADGRTETVKDKTYRDLSPLRAGDEISVRCQPDGSGKLFAVKIWARVIMFSATVRYLNGDEIEVVTIPDADYDREEHRIVHLYPDTVFGTSRKDLSVGQRVRIVGLDVGNGAIDGSRVALYNTDVPADRERRK